MFGLRQAPKYILAAAFAAALLLAAPAGAQNAHGAIAFGQTAQGKSVAYGFAWNFAAGGEARAAAMNACVGRGGKNCVELASFQNGCGALALDQYGMAQGKSGMSRDRAEARAQRTCEAAGGSGCAVVGSQCASPGGQAGTWSGSESVLAAPVKPRGPTAGKTASANRPAMTGAARDEALTREQRIRVQRGLAALGFEAGPADGMFGPRTRSAIREWQQAKGLGTTGYLTRDEAEALAAAGAELGKKPPPREAARRIRSGNRALYVAAAGPKCAGMPEGSRCWKRIANKPGCFLFDDHYLSDQTVTWSGDCSGDTAHGRGTLHWRHPDFGVEGTGEYVHGKRQGRWVKRTSNGGVQEGPYVNGVRQGHWVIRWAKGSRFEGEFRDGQPNGYGAYTSPSGEVFEGQWRDGCFKDRDGRQWFVGTTKEACGFK